MSLKSENKREPGYKEGIVKVVMAHPETFAGLEDVQLDPVSARFQDACNKIASEAIRNGSSDNVTVMLVSITKQ